MRPGWTEIRPGIGVPTEGLREPAYLNQRHVDGPLLSWGVELHWLTLTERAGLRLGLLTVDKIAARRWPDYVERHK